MKSYFAFNEPLAPYNSWRIGGPAERFFRPADVPALQEFLQQESPSQMIHWLGLGSNILIPDEGLRGTTIHTLNTFKELTLDGLSLRVGAGCPCARVAKLCAKAGFRGGLFLAGIPGTIGGALAMNAGAYGSEIWSWVSALKTINRQGQIFIRKPHEYQVAYRHVQGPAQEWFIEATLDFEHRTQEPLEHELRALMQKRRAAQPIGQLSCGSVFRNPAGDSAGRLIEAANLKGYRIGGAEVSLKHANFIINTGHASARDVQQLIAYIIESVWTRFSIRLIPEVRMLRSSPDAESDFS